MPHLLPPEVDQADDAELERALRRVLARKAQQEASCVHVGVHAGCASLNGRVRSLRAWMSVREAIQATPGLQGVDDQLLVES